MKPRWAVYVKNLMFCREPQSLPPMSKFVTYQKGSLPDMSTPNPNYPILELRVALTTSDYERLVKFYCDGLGIEPAQFWNNGQGRALILNMGNATLEIFNETQAETNV